MGDGEAINGDDGANVLLNLVPFTGIVMLDGDMVG